MRILVLGPQEGWHANELRQAAAAHGDEIAYATYESLTASSQFQRARVCGSDAGEVGTFDRVLTRTMPMGTLEQITFRLSVMHCLCDGGLKFCNPPRSLERAIDKYTSTMQLASLGLDVPRTCVSQSRTEALEAFKHLGGDVVVKPLFGGEGRGVMRVQNEDLAWTTFTTLQQLGAVIYQQEFIASGGRDVRVLMIGDRMWALERTNHQDWRTNYARGSEIKQIPLPEPLESIAKSIGKSFNLSIAGLDFIYRGPEQLVALEVNGVPGWKGAQSVIDECLADQIIRTLHSL